MERTQVQADWADPSDPPTHTATPSTRQDHQHNQLARGWVASGLCISTMDRGSRSQASIGASRWLLHSPLHIAPQQTSQIDYRAPSPRARGSCFRVLLTSCPSCTHAASLGWPSLVFVDAESSRWRRFPSQRRGSPQSQSALSMARFCLGPAMESILSPTLAWRQDLG